MIAKTREAFEASLQKIPNEEIERQLDIRLDQSVRQLMELYEQQTLDAEAERLAIAQFTVLSMARTNDFRLHTWNEPGAAIRYARQKVNQAAEYHAQVDPRIYSSILFTDDISSLTKLRRRAWAHLKSEVGTDNAALRADIAAGTAEIV